jgi:hypothetical protein
MDDKKLTIPRNVVHDLHQQLIPEDVEPNMLLCLGVVIEGTSLNLRELAAYLALIDKAYGRLSPSGIYAYSHRPEEQLEIDSVSHGSIELKFIEIISNIHNIQALLFIFLILKYLPNVIEVFSKAYKNYEEGRLLRERRKMLREQVRRDRDLAALSDLRKNQVVELVDTLLLRVHSHLPGASKFARKSVRQVRIKIIPKDEENSTNE